MTDKAGIARRFTESVARPIAAADAAPTEQWVKGTVTGHDPLTVLAQGGSHQVEPIGYVPPIGTEVWVRFGAGQAPLALVAPSTDQPVLWSGSGYWMTASQSVALSQNVTAQKTGIILAWSAHSGGSRNYGWSFTHIPKWQVQNYPGAGVSCLLGDNTSPGYIYKYVYVNNGSVVGNDINDDAPANTRVLRAVIGY